MRYALIRDHSKELRVENAYRVLKVSVSGYYAWSGRGGQYASIEYQRALAKQGMLCSMGRKGDC